jgi:hypothetical protein
VEWDGPDSNFWDGTTLFSFWLRSDKTSPFSVWFRHIRSGVNYLTSGTHMPVSSHASYFLPIDMWDPFVISFIFFFFLLLSLSLHSQCERGGRPHAPSMTSRCRAGVPPPTVLARAPLHFLLSSAVNLGSFLLSSTSTFLPSWQAAVGAGAWRSRHGVGARACRSEARAGAHPHGGGGDRLLEHARTVATRPELCSEARAGPRSSRGVDSG